MATHHKGPILGDPRSVVYENLPIDLVARRDYEVFFTDFVHANDLRALTDETIGGWIETDIAGTNTAAIADDVGYGALLLTTGSTEDDGICLQYTDSGPGEFITLTANKLLVFDTRVKCNDPTQSDIIIGTTITEGTSPNPFDGAELTDGIYFECLDASNSVSFVNEKNSTETQTDAVTTLSDATWTRLSFRCLGTSTVLAYVDDKLVATHTTNIPDDEELTITLAILTGEAAAQTLEFDYLMVAKER
jgi:hypothetical protein